MSQSQSISASPDGFPDLVPGDMTGVAFPPTVDSFRKAGPAFLTRAFQAVGALEADNRVTALTDIKEFVGGGMGRKLKFSVSYERPGPHLLDRLFVKFTREFGDPLRELFSPVMEPEARFALLSRRPDFPVRVPECYYADYNRETMTGLLITECVAYGEGAIDPIHDKCLDYLATVDLLPRYQAQTRAMAALAAFHRSGRFGDEVERYFPFNPVVTTGIIPYTADQLAEKLDILDAFAADHPTLLPEAVTRREFLEPFRRDALLVRDVEIPMLNHLFAQRDMVALCHWNMNLDNAWFWTEPDGSVRSGLLDWGGVSQMSLAQAFHGMTCAAEPDFLVRHEDGLMRLLLDEYARLGGPRIELARFTRLHRMAQAILGVAWMLDAPSLIAAQYPDLATLTSRFDPDFKEYFIPRAQLGLMSLFLHEWQRHDIGAIIRDFSDKGE